MKIQQQIESKLQAELTPVFLEVINESKHHQVPPDSESHFKVTIASPRFADQNLLARHRLINRLLAEELAGPVHALALHTFSTEEWSEHTTPVAASPNCLGRRKK